MTLQFFLALAVDAEASQNQIDVLTNAVESGSISFEQISGLEDDLLECYEDAGFTVSSVSPVEVYPNSEIFTFEGFILPPEGLTEQEEGDLVNHCYTHHFTFANSAYLESPVAVEARYAIYTDPGVIECLRSLGYRVDDNASGSEIRQIIQEDIGAHYATDPTTPYIGCEPRTGG